MQTMLFPHDGATNVYTWREGVGIIVNACKTYGTRRIGRGKNARDYYNAFLTFDIETTKLTNELWRDKMPLSLRYFNYTYLWGCYCDGKFIAGREIKDFFEMLSAVQLMISGAYLCSFVHNLAFEYFNNIDYFTKADYEDGFFRNASTPLYIRLKGFEFRCTAQLTHKTLAQIGKDVKIAKLDDFAYDRLLSPKSELSVNDYNYQYRDVLIVAKFIENEVKQYAKRAHVEENPAALPLTQTGYVRHDVKKNFSRTNAGYRLLQNTALTEAEYMFIRPAFYGGNVHNNFRTCGVELRRDEGNPLLHVDLKSAYPWAIVTKKFLLKLSEFDGKVSEATLRRWLQDTDFGFVADLVLIGVDLKKNHIPYIAYDNYSVKNIPIDSVSENGKLVSAEALQITICDEDLRLILETYDVESIEVKRLFYGIKRRLPYNIVATVISYFCSKTTLKDVTTGDAEADAYIAYLYGLEKQKLNGIYGLFSTSLCNFEYNVNAQTLEVVKSDTAKYKQASVLPYQCALQITAYVRAAIVNMCHFLCNAPGNQFWYCDTDSIFCRDTPEARAYVEEWNTERRKEAELLRNLYFDVMPKNPKGVTQILGSFDFEPDTNESVAFCSIGAKRYYVIYKDGTAEITFSGLRATKRVKDKKTGKYKNGYNTQRLIDMYGSLNAAFNAIKRGKVTLPFVDGVDKLSHFNVRAPFVSHEFGYRVERPCTYTLIGQSLNLSLNPSLKWFLESEKYHDIMEEEIA